MVPLNQLFEAGFYLFFGGRLVEVQRIRATCARSASNAGGARLAHHGPGGPGRRKKPCGSFIRSAASFIYRRNRRPWFHEPTNWPRPSRWDDARSWRPSKLRDLIVAHAVELVVGRIVLAHMVGAEEEIFAIASAALRCAVGTRPVAALPLAARHALLGVVLARPLAPTRIESKLFRVELHVCEYDPSPQGRQVKPAGQNGAVARPS